MVAEGSDQRSANDEVSQVLRLESSHESLQSVHEHDLVGGAER